MSYLSDKDYNFIYSSVPRICIDVLIKNERGEVLLTKRNIEPYKDHWHMPGGRIQFRETIKDAYNRIIKNELGIEFTNESDLPMIGVMEFLEEVQDGNKRHSISIVYQALSINEEFNDGTFFTELPEPIIPMHRDFIINKKLL